MKLPTFWQAPGRCQQIQTFSPPKLKKITTLLLFTCIPALSNAKKTMVQMAGALKVPDEVAMSTIPEPQYGEALSQQHKILIQPQATHHLATLTFSMDEEASALPPNDYLPWYHRAGKLRTSYLETIRGVGLIKPH